MYLGLVLVGATPQVLAQAAMTKQFNVKDEIEHKDDLDIKPDGDKAIEQFALSFGDLYKIAAEISIDHPDKVSEGQYSFNCFFSQSQRGLSTMHCPGSLNNGTHIHSGRNNQPLRQLYDAFIARSDSVHEKFLIQFGFGDAEVSFRTTITASDSLCAASAASVFDNALARHRLLEANLIRSLIFEASKVTVENNKIIIVTRLPRGSLDSLLR